MQANQDLASGCSKKPSITTMELGLVIQFVTGNCYLMKHMSMLEPGMASECRVCLEEEEDPMHLWCCFRLSVYSSVYIYVHRAGVYITNISLTC